MDELKLASWNIRKCVGLDRRRDPRRVAGVLADLDADVVVLQEADKRLGRRPAALPHHLLVDETPYLPVDAGGHEMSIGWHGNAILVAPSVEAFDVHPLTLPGVEPRGALVLDFTRGGQDWRVVAVHLGLLRQSRRAQMAAIREALHGRDHRPTVILGDFNEWSPERGFEPLEGFEVHAPGRTYHAARPIAALDRIAIGADVDLRDAGVVETPTTRVASDHLPIHGTVSVVR